MLGKLIRDVSPSCATDFVRRLAFVIASGNGDAHLKNWSLQWEHHHRPHLAPCYDQVSTVSWERYGWEGHSEPELALALGKVRRFSKINAEVVSRFARRSTIPEASDIFWETLREARGPWAEIAEQAPERMRMALVKHWERVPVLRRIGPLIE